MLLNEHEGGLVEAIVRNTKATIEPIFGGTQIAVVTNGQLIIENDPRRAVPVALKTCTLRSIVDAHDAPWTQERGPLVVHVVNAQQVVLMNPAVGNYAQQFNLVCATAAAKRLPLEWMSTEEFIIAAQTTFFKNEGRDEMLAYCASLTASNIISIKDDGASQSVETATGLISKSVAGGKCANPLALQPMRTFAEIESPISPFTLRVRSEGEGDKKTIKVALFEANEQAWQTESIARIAEWLKEKLPAGVLVLS